MIFSSRTLSLRYTDQRIMNLEGCPDEFSQFMKDANGGHDLDLGDMQYANLFVKSNNCFNK